MVADRSVAERSPLEPASDAGCAFAALLLEALKESEPVCNEGDPMPASLQSVRTFAVVNAHGHVSGALVDSDLCALAWGRGGESGASGYRFVKPGETLV